jgi:flagellar hook protein FlgE
VIQREPARHLRDEVGERPTAGQRVRARGQGEPLVPQPPRSSALARSLLSFTAKMTLRSLQPGASRRRVEADALGVLGEDSAPLEPPGGEHERASFEDLFKRGGAGLGSRPCGARHALEHGSPASPGLAHDVALNGDGFFVVGGSVNGLTGTFYARAGQFRLDAAGTLVDQLGLAVMGKALAPDGVPGPALGPLKLPPGAIPAEPTSELRLSANLDGAAEISTAPFDLHDPEGTSSFGSEISVFDSLGSPHSLQLYFNKRGPGLWEYRAVLGGDELEPKQPGAHVQAGSGTLEFTNDGALGKFSPAEPVRLNLGQGSAGPAIALNFGLAVADGGSGLEGTTQFSMPSGVTSQSQNGYSSGSLKGLEIGSDGSVSGRYDNGESVRIGQLQIAKFRATDALARAGNNLWLETPESGSAALAPPGAGGRGQVMAQGVEQADVDVRDDMVAVLQHQRSFRPSSRVIATADELLSQLMQLKR